MVNLNNIWAVATMERRHTRRLARYWVFLSIAYLFGIGGYVYYSFLHAFFSSLSASVGMIGPLGFDALRRGGKCCPRCRHLFIVVL